ncbi:hypothetical protein [Tsukamurella sp. 1534]|uniref:hypothetical protein n=1 Tax=Tsukamurella sp. 1534 TaxID=1151061 RepID=UPI0002EEDC23|nr:hypothetical protein [Tsukamurella sp. 1534]
MNTSVAEIGPDVFRISTWVDAVTPDGFTFNQFLIRDEQPFLFHTGMRSLFPLVSEAVARLIALEDLRWVAFGHVEADECGSMNRFLAAAPTASVIHGELACTLSLNDMCDRPPVAVPSGPEAQPLDIGSHRLRFLSTPHVPHNWEAGLWFEEETRTLFAGDLLTHTGHCPAITDSDVVDAALAADGMFHATALTKELGSTLDDLAALDPRTLAIMHGASYEGDGAGQLRALARGYAAM